QGLVAQVGCVDPVQWFLVIERSSDSLIASPVPKCGPKPQLVLSKRPAERRVDVPDFLHGINRDQTPGLQRLGQIARLQAVVRVTGRKVHLEAVSTLSGNDVA